MDGFQNFPGPAAESRLAIDCLPLPTFDLADFAAVKAAFLRAALCRLGQAWRRETEGAFSPGEARAGWRENRLLIFAELSDRDIFSRATENGQRMWELGDTFEMFFRPEDQEAYVEFHVTPNNLRLQLRFPNAGSVEDSRRNGLGQYRLAGELFRSATWIDSQANRWFICAEIPAEAVGPPVRSLRGRRWRFSFSRYDYTRSCEEPVISSSSPHPRADFHRQEDWGALHFKGE